MGRIVITHSTYIEGLIPLLRRLARLKEIQTITPAIIKRSKSNSHALKLRISTEIKGGYKLIARKGYAVQEVFIITSLKKEQLESQLSNSRK